MTGCETSTDFMFPLQVDVYYPIVTQEGYGNVKRQWVFDRTISCYFASPTSKTKEENLPELKIITDSVLVGRVRSELTKTSRGDNNSVTNILLANIRDKDGNVIYNESAGPRSGLSTIFEIATFVPSVGPFGGIEFYKVVLRRSENQAADL
jgi:hypothetical protein